MGAEVSNPTLIVFFWSVINLIELLIFSGILYFSYSFLEKKDAPLKYKMIVLLLILPMVIFLPAQANIIHFDKPWMYSLYWTGVISLDFSDRSAIFIRANHPDSYADLFTSSG